MAIRLNSEKKIENNKFKLKLGTTNKLNPQIVYIEGRTFISPNDEESNYSKDISEIKTNFSKNISRTLKTTNLFQNKFIIDFQVSTNGIKMNKKSFLSFQFLLRQNEENILKLKDLKNAASDLINDIVYSLEKDIREHQFNVYKTKKESIY